MKKEKPIYVLRRHSTEFPLDDFTFKRYMSVDGGEIETIAIFESKEEALRETSKFCNDVHIDIFAKSGVIIVTEYLLWEKYLDELEQHTTGLLISQQNVTEVKQ